jgi:hypothetical protein
VTVAVFILLSLASEGDDGAIVDEEPSCAGTETQTIVEETVSNGILVRIKLAKEPAQPYRTCRHPWGHPKVTKVPGRRTQKQIKSAYVP